MYILIRIVCILIFFTPATFAQTFATWTDYCIVVEKFYDLVAQKNPPTVQDFFNIFGTVYLYEQILIKEHYLELGLTEQQSTEKSEAILEKADLYESLVFKKIRENKSQIFPDEVYEYNQNIFVALDTCSTNPLSDASLNVIVKKDGQMKTIKFILCPFKDCGPFGPTIEAIILKDGSSYLQSITGLK